MHVRAQSYDGVIFDLDGTLADTLHDIAAAMNHVLSAHQLPTHPIDAYRGFLGSGVGVLVERALPSGSEERHGELLAAFRERYLDQLIVETRAFPGIDELLADLDAAGVSLAVLSNKPQVPTARIVATLFPTVGFRAVYGQRPEIPRKPDPSAALAIASELDLPPARIAFVGDTAIDMETAVGAGMLPVAVSWGFRGIDELRRAGARHLLAHPSELVTLP